MERTPSIYYSCRYCVFVGYGRPLYGYGSAGGGMVWRGNGRFRSMGRAKYDKPYYKPYKSGKKKKNRSFGGGYKPRPRKYGGHYMPRRMFYGPELYPGRSYGGYRRKMKGPSIYGKRGSPGYAGRYGKGFAPQRYIPMPKPKMSPKKAVNKVRKFRKKKTIPRIVYPVG